MSKKVLIFSTAYLPFIGGAEVAIKEITDRLPSYDFALVTARMKTSLPKTEKIGNVTVYRLGLGFGLDKIFLAFYGSRWAQKNIFKPDVVWAMMASFGGLAARNYKKSNPDVPYLLSLQEGDDLTEVKKKMRFYHRGFMEVFSLANRVQVISKYLANWAKEMGTNCPLDIVPNGVSLDLYLDKKKRNVTKNLEERTIITTSRLVKKNGVADIVKALAILPNNYRLRVVGAGPEEEHLKKLVITSGLVGRADFLGSVVNDKIPELLAEADLFVRPSLSEGLGNSFLEAMAIGLPIIGTPVGGIPDFLQDGVTGWFCQVGNPTNLAEKIRYVMDADNEAEVYRVISQAKDLVAKNYDWAKIAEKMNNIFGEMIKSYGV